MLDAKFLNYVTVGMSVERTAEIYLVAASAADSADKSKVIGR